MDQSHHTLNDTQSLLAGTASPSPESHVSASVVSKKDRSPLRAERHPNAVTAPTLNRGSMLPAPWRGFWNGMASVLPSQDKPAAQNVTSSAAKTSEKPLPWQRAASRRRSLFLILTFISTAFASKLFSDLQPAYNNAWLTYGQLALFALLTAWVVTGFMTAMMGFYVTLRGDRWSLSAKDVKDHSFNDDARTAIIMPICNEDVRSVFAGLRATCESIANTKHVGAFDVFVLSDSNDVNIQKAERQAWEELRTQLAGQPDQPQIEVYYRLRTRRTHRKAGNVADFCRRWGKDYRYMVVLDADSVMSGDCLVSLVKLMEANPKAGIIQTATQSIGHATLHARAQQFASRMTGRLFTLGMQFWQLGESHYWGHNAILRVAPFMEHCALAPITGTGGMAGGIMSHDFVEAALMRRAGFYVWLVSDLTGSYEQQPPDLLSELQRDRRWCQGNLQNARLIAEPGIHPVHRSMFGTGAMAYLSAPLWLSFLTLGTALWLSGTPMIKDWNLLPAELFGIWAWTLSILFLPRVLGIAAVLIKKEQASFGGTAALLRSALLETLLALLQAPLRMMAHSLFVAVAITGLKLEWKSPPREAVSVSWKHAIEQLAPMSLVIAALAAGIALIDVSALIWLIPVGLPLLLAVPLTVISSQPRLGAVMRAQGFLLIPEETRSPAVLRRAWMHARPAAKPRLLAA
ncbi:Glucans biosynthesis glucosyltransferase H [Polaromonas vacuolata]|uniref:Glucans biosynthesis glucosyltransferase H n=1 Tax=Polaromonas vacuolata TaxID=37448 RepID=A0A6H2HCZ2_9BURK|nr:glucans biosynthesis glucosyltransferase MdoH [Polaromonas vacuolata]QJC57454.1 Glucans biosynthesis glucosyltransferase H [Polaromonas vacuolata]